MTVHPQLNLRVDEVFLKRLDDWRRSQVDLPNRPEAVRRLVDLALDTPATSTRTARRSTAAQRKGRGQER